MFIGYSGLAVILQQIPQVWLNTGTLHHLFDGAA